MFRLIQPPNVANKKDKVYNKELSIKNHILYLNIEDSSYKFSGVWYVKDNDNWISLGTGIIDYTSETCLDKDLFEEVEDD